MTTKVMKKNKMGYGSPDKIHPMKKQVLKINFLKPYQKGKNIDLNKSSKKSPLLRKSLQKKISPIFIKTTDNLKWSLTQPQHVILPLQIK